MSEKYAFIVAEDATVAGDTACAPTVTQMCGWLQVSRSGFYEWKSRPVSAAAKRRRELKLLITKAFEDSDGTYGYRRIALQLARWGVQAGLELVRALMRELGLVACQPRPWRPSTTQQGQAGPIPDLVARDFSAAVPGEKMVGDITYIPTWEGWLYLATVIDCATRKVAGWAMDDNYKTPLITAAIEMAARNFDLPADAIFHSDRGSNGGFNRLSQHLDQDVFGWDGQRSGSRQRQGGRRCGRRDGRRWRGGCTGNGSGRRSRWALRARTPVSRPACRRRLGAGGSGSVAACRHRTSGPHSGRYLSFFERDEIAICRAYGYGVREIARHLGRSPSNDLPGAAAKRRNPRRHARLPGSARAVAPGSPGRPAEDRQAGVESAAARVRAGPAGRRDPRARWHGRGGPAGPAVERQEQSAPPGPALGRRLEPGADRPPAGC